MKHFIIFFAIKLYFILQEKEVVLMWKKSDLNGQSERRFEIEKFYKIVV